MYISALISLHGTILQHKTGFKLPHTTNILTRLSSPLFRTREVHQPLLATIMVSFIFV